MILLGDNPDCALDLFAKLALYIRHISFYAILRAEVRNRGKRWSVKCIQSQWMWYNQ